MQCVDCVREQAQGARYARTTFGGRPTERPLVTQLVVAACVVVFLLQMVVPGLTSRFALVPALVPAQPDRVLTSAFLHSPSFLLHIAFNMYALWVVGGYLEHLLGRARFLAVYLLSALGGSLGYVLLAEPFSAAVGASGAVFGLFGALVVLQRRLGRDAGPMVGMIAINGVLGFVVPGIAWQAHLGGLVVGALAAAVLAYAPRRRRTAVHAGGLAVLGLVVVGLLLTAVPTGP